MASLKAFRSLNSGYFLLILAKKLEARANEALQRAEIQRFSASFSFYERGSFCGRQIGPSPRMVECL